MIAGTTATAASMARPIFPEEWLCLCNPNAWRMSRPAGRRLLSELRALPGLQMVELPPPGRRMEPALATFPRRGLLVCGGDGSVNRVANELDPDRHILGILPLGRGNGVAADLGCASLNDAREALESGHVISLDILETTWTRDDGAVTTTIAVNAVGFGTLAQAVGRARRFHALGMFGYEVAGLLNLGRAAEYRVEVDGRQVYEGRLAGVIVLNTGHIGSLAPSATADPCDGELDVLLQEPGVFTEKLFELRAVLGRQEVRPRPLRGGRAVIRSPLGQPLYLDGEILGRVNRVEVTLRPARIPCLASANARWNA